MKEKRNKVWIDRFQTSLVLRIALYFILYQFTVWSLVILEHSISRGVEMLLGEGAAWYSSFFLTSVVVVLGILFIYDALHFAHRLVGPLYRFRQTVKAITAGDELRLVNLREGDFLQELKDDFNEMLQALEQRGALVLKSPEAKQRSGETQAV
jgi:hypothetical protein